MKQSTRVSTAASSSRQCQGVRSPASNPAAVNSCLCKRTMATTYSQFLPPGTAKSDGEAAELSRAVQMSSLLGQKEAELLNLQRAAVQKLEAQVRSTVCC